MSTKLLKIKGEYLQIDTPLVMGIVNISTNSFFSGSRVYNEENLLRKVERMLWDGADIIDIGAVSTQPGAVLLSAEEEWARLAGSLYAIRKTFGNDIVVSVDTVNANVASMAVREYGVDIINDISGGQVDEKMFEIIAGINVPYIVMHMRGTPDTMQQFTSYNNLMGDILYYFSERLNRLHQFGVSDIIIDPGFGFSKNIEQNYELLQHLESFHIFEKPILVGISRKSMIYKTLNCSPEEALNGSTALHTVALMKGADILRVHDVKEAKETIKLIGVLKSKENPEWI
ncbi:MAG: dihydropteroate synthase [Bacteroidales bacterium]|nr:dihydropteroate synthase [Bacteroidales bacterium]HOY38607.1 dihydropteroate synthase [Bacteroidales bacterium]HQP04506.1 dihydropteroate synthase [Bacteroidales bacterium]